MARLRSENPERLRTPSLTALQRLVEQMSTEELVLARPLVTHQLARIEQFTDDPLRRERELTFECLIAMDDADLCCRERTGEPLRVAQDYRDHRGPEAPSLNKVIRVLGGTWGAALHNAGLVFVAQPEVELTMQPGSPAKAKNWSLDDCVAAYALMTERFRGRRFSEGAYEVARQAHPDELPTFQQIRRVITGKPGKSQGALREVRAAADRRIAKNPSAYPLAFAYQKRARAVRR